ncbi:MAG: oligoribonuclease [Acidimicrobiales bacterium]
MLAWMDLEMTGLDPGRNVIVEIAVLVTDDELQIVAEGPDLVVSATEEQLGAMEDIVRAMHTRSGLLEAISASTVSLEEAGAAVLEFLKDQIPEPRTVPLAGNSIGTDRRFLATYLPDIENWLHYRSVDVSTLKELCRRWYPEVLAKAPGKQTAHRAMDDIKESVAELVFYREAIFKSAG